METLHNKLRQRAHKIILKRLYKWAIKEKAPPVRMVILPTNRCNANCLFCGAVPLRKNPDFDDYKDELSKKRWIQIVKEAAELGVKEWLIGGGGEPMMRVDTVLAMIRTIKKVSPESVIEISTNGWFLTDEVAKKLVKHELDLIQIGIDGPNAETHDFLRGKKGLFEKVTNGVKQLSKMKKKFGEEKPVIKIHVVLNSRNYDKLTEMASLDHSFGANFFAVAAMRVDEGNLPAIEKANLRLNKKQKKEVHKIWKEVEEFAEKNDLELGPAFHKGMEEVSDIIEPKKPKPSFKNKKINNFLSAFCFAPFYSLIVDWAGNVGPCACAGSVENPKNNVAKKSLEEIWYGKFFKCARNQMLNGEPLDLESLIPIEKNDEGKALNPCETCGINIERGEIDKELPALLKQKNKMRA